MSSRPRPDRPAVVRRFAAVTLLAVVVLGGALSTVVQRVVEDQSVDSATRSAALLSRLAEAEIASRSGAPLDGPVDRSVGLALDAAVERAAADGLLALRVYGPDGTVAYDSRRLAVGLRLPALGARAAAYDGERVAAVRDDGRERGFAVEQVVDVASPIRLPGAPVPAAVAPSSGRASDVVGVIELALSHQEAHDRAVTAARTVAGVAVAGLGVLWLLMFRLSARVSSALRERAADADRAARVDRLTGLPNRLALLGDLTDRLAEQEGGGRLMTGLVVIDLDRFAAVNESLGQEAGDLLLQAVADRLLSHTGATAAGDAHVVVAHLGADEFAVVLPSVTGPVDAHRRAAAVLGVFDAPFGLRDLQVQVDASAGVAVAPYDADSAAELLQRASVALAGARTTHQTVSSYRPDLDVSTPERLALLAELRTALQTGAGLQLLYQPVVDLPTGRTVGVEALLRWSHPSRGLLTPDDVLPIAERTPLVRDLTRHVLHQALGQCRRWMDQGLVLTVAVNLSARNLGEDDLPQAVAAALATHGVPASLLHLEITESAVVDDPAGARRVADRLVALGVDLSMDDFGTGFSSMTSLMQMPLRVLKVDRSFVTGLDAAESGGVITRATVRMAHELGLLVVAEGIDTPAQYAALRAIGCDLGQGYLFARPLEPADVAAHVAAGPVQLPTALPATAEALRGRYPRPSGG